MIARTPESAAVLLDLAHDAIFVHGLDDSALLFWNAGAAAMYGWTRAEALGRPTRALLRTRFPVPLETIMAALLDAGSWTGELIQTTRDGRELVVESRWALRRDASGRPEAILEINTDITEHRQAEEALRAAEMRLGTVVANAPIVLLATDGAGVVVLCEGRKCAELSPDGTPLVGQTLATVYRADPAAGDQIRRALAGHETGFISRIDAAFLETHLVPLRDAAGGVSGLIGVATDVTARVRTEAAERALRERDAFLAIAAHELKTPLTSLRGFVQLLLSHLERTGSLDPARLARALRDRGADDAGKPAGRPVARRDAAGGGAANAGAAANRSGASRRGGGGGRADADARASPGGGGPGPGLGRRAAPGAGADQSA